MNVPDREMFADIKGVIRSRKSKNDRQYNGQNEKDKQWYAKYYTEYNYRFSNQNHTTNGSELGRVEVSAPLVAHVVLPLVYTRR